MKENYYIKRGYQSRDQVPDFDDTSFKDEWQDEVYAWANQKARTKNLTKVYDIGVGSGYKLNKYMHDLDISGSDSERTVSFLKDNYPNGNWENYCETNYSDLRTDLLICSDVIEHVLNPNELLTQIAMISEWKYLFISTPERDVKWGQEHLGPPPNIYHFREWNSIEFVNLLSDYFEVTEHRITNMSQGTQCVLCTPLKA